MRSWTRKYPAHNNSKTSPTAWQGHLADVGVAHIAVVHTEGGLNADLHTVLVFRVVRLVVPVALPALSPVIITVIINIPTVIMTRIVLVGVVAVVVVTTVVSKLLSSLL